jgi:Tol biopolymer transport system component
MVMGTVRYMSPEQARAVKMDTRTDIFSLGVVFYEMITGRLPFDGETNTDVLAAILTKEPPPLNRYVREVPQKLQSIIKKTLQKDKEERYQNIKELIFELEELKLEINDSLRQTNVAEQHLIRTKGAVSSEINRSVVSTVLIGKKETASARITLSENRQNKKVVITVLAGLLILGLGIAATLYKWLGSERDLLSASGKALEFTKLAVTNFALKGRISPDGKYVAYTVLSSEGQSVWVKQIETGEEFQAVPPAHVSFYGLNFSRDGKFIFYLTVNLRIDPRPVLYCVPTLGGTQQKMLENIITFTLSPDDKMPAFTRFNSISKENELWVSNFDGSNERKLAARMAPSEFRCIDWSPDGKQIAATVLEQESGNKYWTVIGVPVEGGTVRPLTKMHWSNGASLLWLPDGSGLILCAAEQGSNKLQLWMISYPSGEVRKITNDSNNYSEITVTADGSMILSPIYSRVDEIWTVPVGDARQSRRLTNRPGAYSYITSTPDGKILFSMVVDENHQISLMEADGNRSRQLTFDSSNHIAPTMSPDKNYIVFSSTRSATLNSGRALNLWRMNSDGSNPKQLTYGEKDSCPEISPDGKWVFYVSQKQERRTLMKVPIEGGEAIELLEINNDTSPTISPDGKLIAFEYRNKADNKVRIAVTSLDTLEELKSFDISSRSNIRWSRDGRGIAYVDYKIGSNEILYQPIAGGPPKQLTDFKSNEIRWFDWSPDGKRLICISGNPTCDMVIIKNFR